MERWFGSVYFGFLLIIFIVLIGLVYVVINIVLLEIMDNGLYRLICVVGFFGVIFVLKVLVMYYSFSGI